MSFVKDNNIEAICFDIDGTFYPKWKMDLRLVKSALPSPKFALSYNKMRQKVREEDGRRLHPLMNRDEIVRRNTKIIFGDDSTENIQRYILEEARLRKSWDNSYRSIKAAPFVRESLIEAREAGLRLGALSDFPIGVKLEAMGILCYFDFTLSAEDMGHFKPSLTPFAEVVKAFSIEPSRILYVGDSYSKDVIGAKGAGMKSCLIFRKPSDKFPEADIIVENWREFLSTVLC